MTVCTWDKCTAEAAHPQTDAHGRVWADLCDAHDTQLAESLAHSVPRMLSAWVNASGGPKKLAESM